MPYFLLILLMLSANLSFACRCAFTDLSATVARSTYIALVRIKEILPADVDSLKYLDENRFKIVVEELKHFKGTHRTEIIVDGGHPKFNTWTSCDFDIYANEEWVVFGREDRGYSIMYACSNSIRLKDSSGFIDWQYQRGVKELTFLEEYFHLPGKSFTKRDGALKRFYTNGQAERLENFSRGKREGKVLYFYPDGSLYGEGTYRRGMLHNDFRWYARNGELISRIHYTMGVVTDTTLHFNIYQSRLKGTLLHIYDYRGEIKASKSYKGHISAGLLERETLYLKGASEYQIREYYPSGQLKSVLNMPSIAGQFDYTQYDESGKLLRQSNRTDRGLLSP
jgi:antitoxin component YwqK of YwqJK toxin-antitoxin module